MAEYHLAQVNIGRIRADLADPVMAGFVDRLAEINALADRSDGFVWRLQSDAGDATYLRPYDDERVLFNMSVWRDLDSLRHFVYRTMHREVLRQREAWFEKFNGVYLALWWVPAGHKPGVDEAKKRLAHLEVHGPSAFAFTFGKPFPMDEDYQSRIDWSSFVPCPAS